MHYKNDEFDMCAAIPNSIWYKAVICASNFAFMF